MAEAPKKQRTIPSQSIEITSQVIIAAKEITVKVLGPGSSPQDAVEAFQTIYQGIVDAYTGQSK